jgi:hypothetical protein
MTAMETVTTVHIWIGSEWAGVRAAFVEFLHDLPTAASVSVLTTSLGPASPTGRIAGWIRAESAETGIPVVARQPGDSVDLVPAADRMLVGITELLLDPDPTQADQLYALGLWSRFVPRRRRLLMRVTPFLDEEIVANAEVPSPDLLLQIAEWNGQRVLIAATDLIAAEVIGRGLRAIAQPAGDVGLNPWQTELVRIASERQLGVTSGPQIELVVHQAGVMPPPVATAFRDLVERVGRLVDCRVSVEG